MTGVQTCALPILLRSSSSLLSCACTARGLVQINRDHDMSENHLVAHPARGSLSGENKISYKLPWKSHTQAHLAAWLCEYLWASCPPLYYYSARSELSHNLIIVRRYDLRLPCWPWGQALDAIEHWLSFLEAAGGCKTKQEMKKIGYEVAMRRLVSCNWEWYGENTVGHKVRAVALGTWWPHNDEPWLTWVMAGPMPRVF